MNADAGVHPERPWIMETYPGVQHQYNPALPLYEVEDGYIEVPETPGLGIDPDPETIKKYKVG